MDIEQLPWDDLRLFLGAMRAGSLSQGAQELRISQPTMSRRIAALEEEIGHPLFDRRVQGLLPTDAAWALFPHAEAMEAAAKGAEMSIAGLEKEPEGLVRVAVPEGIAADLLPPVVAQLRSRYGGLLVEVLADNRAVDLARREADIAIRAVRPESGDLYFQKLPDVPLQIFVSAAYRARLPDEPRLSDLDWIQYSDELRGFPTAVWVERVRGERPCAMRSNSFLTMRQMAVAGLGAIVLPSLQGQAVGLCALDGIEAQAAEPLPEIPWYLVVHGSIRRVPRVRVVIDALHEEVARLLSSSPR